MKIRITVIGHSTVLLETPEKRILTDPYFGTWGNPAYRRTRPPARSREELREIDLVLLSHNHWDHTDRKFFRSLSNEVPVLAPRRASLVSRLKGARNVQGVVPWEERRFGTLDVTAVPALHMATTVGFVLRTEETQVYFAGDTYYRPFMREIGQRFDLDVALIPVTTYRIPMTMGERSAVRAVKDLEPDVVIPVHLGVIPRSPLLRTSQTVQGFARRLTEAGLETRVEILAEGESCTLD